MPQRTRIFPESRHEGKFKSLSILDATVARFSPAGGIWIYDSIPSNIQAHDFVQHLQSSLSEALNSFPHFAGQLMWSPFHHNGNHTERWGRPMVKYGTNDDPGVECGVVHHGNIAASVLAPSSEERASTRFIWDGNEFPQNSLISPTLLALHDLHSYHGLPGVSIQINLFSDNGYAISVKISHVLADAQTLMVFVQLWAQICRARLGVFRPSPLGRPIFEPQLLDSYASGNVDANQSDPTLVAAARSIPLHRFDWWHTNVPGYPSKVASRIEASKPPPYIIGKCGGLSESTVPPWNTWDFSKPVSYTLLHFTGSKIDHIRSNARSEKGARQDISRLDALLAFIWQGVNCARRNVECSGDVYLDITIGARARLEPKLPPNFIGSPLFITYVKAKGSEVCMGSIGALSTNIRNAISFITPEKMGSMLHDAAYELSPQRLWQAFLGNQHLLVTSWLRLDPYSLDFDGTGRKPRYVHSVMDKCDGIVTIMDTGADDGGFDVSLYLERHATQRFLSEMKF